MGADGTPSPRPLPQGGEGFALLSPFSEGEGGVRALFPSFRVPRAGGDPEPYTQVRINDLNPRLRGGRG